MSRLFDNLKQSAIEWRHDGYTCDDYPLIGEILAYQTEHQADTTPLRFLRAPQFFALEVYCFDSTPRTRAVPACAVPAQYRSR